MGRLKEGKFTRRICSQSLEGSRFGTCPDKPAIFVSRLIRPKCVKAGGSRERLSAMQLYESIVNTFGGHA